MDDIELKELPYAKEEQVNDLLIQARVANKKGDTEQSLALALKAWNLIPEPKDQWKLYPKVAARGIADKYVKLGNVAKFKEWMDICYQVYHDPERKNIYVLMDEGIGFFKLGQFAEALAIFRKAYKLYGSEAFPPEYSQYYKFLMENQRNF